MDVPFYSYLRVFLSQEKEKVYHSFKPLTRTFLNFNNPDNPGSFLRRPQFEALEIYVFLKEFCENRFLLEIFQDWFYKKNLFEGQSNIYITSDGQYPLLDSSTEHFHETLMQMEHFKQIYPNYIFALTMGLGKTILMATSIFYEFLLAHKYPKDKRFCHNALVFAPDKTVLNSLKEIEAFDTSKVIPTAYVHWLNTHVQFHFLDKTGYSLNTIDHSKYNIIISNTQKIILKKLKLHVYGKRNHQNLNLIFVLLD